MQVFGTAIGNFLRIIYNSVKKSPPLVNFYTLSGGGVWGITLVNVSRMSGSCQVPVRFLSVAGFANFAIIGGAKSSCR